MLTPTTPNIFSVLYKNRKKIVTLQHQKFEETNYREILLISKSDD